MKLKLLLIGLLLQTILFGQEESLPVGLSEDEKALIEWYDFSHLSAPRGLPTPPPVPVRHMAEWEELQALAISWRSYPTILTQIVLHASQEVPVVIFCNDQAAKNSATTSLQNAGVNLAQVQFVVTPTNSVWIRDYGPNCVYANDVDSLYFIDWVYNRITRPQDDVVPDAAGEHFGVPVYATIENPERMVNTGGNFMSDGLGTAFASRLILDENAPGNDFNAGPHTEAEIDSIMQKYMGLGRYVKMTTLPYDAIHHIDMHMRLLDEETLLVGQYPTGMSDGPQIEANIDYVLSNYSSAFGTPYQVVRVVQPPDFNGSYPPFGDYRTYTNAVFVNKTILIPTYEEEYDTTALRVYREFYPGYKVVGINCNDMISASGALHCITKEIGSTDPLWMVHQRLKDLTDNQLQGNYEVNATIKNKSGIAAGQVFYTTDTLLPYQAVSMALTDAVTDTWTGYIPHQANGSRIFYYLEGEANSGKKQVRPLVAPEGYYTFKVDGLTSAAGETLRGGLQLIYPNPAAAITVVPIQLYQQMDAVLEVQDVLGRRMQVLFDGVLPAGESKHFLDASGLSPGTYIVVLKTSQGVQSGKLMVK